MGARCLPAELCPAPQPPAPRRAARPPPAEPAPLTQQPRRDPPRGRRRVRGAVGGAAARSARGSESGRGAASAARVPPPGAPRRPGAPGQGWVSGAGAVPARPDDPVLQESGRRPEPAAPPEAFTVGLETFSWTPLPPAPRGGGGLGHSRHVLRGAGGLPGSPARSPQQCLAPKLPSTQEQRLVDGAQILRSCPMCQADFAPG